MTTTRITTEPVVSEFVVRSHLHPGLSDSGKIRDERFEPTRAGLARALDRRDSLAISLAGRYGSATAAAYVAMADGEIEIGGCGEHSIDEDRARNLCLRDGQEDPADIHDMIESIWDGNNHVEFFPARSMYYLADAHHWIRDGHALLHINDDGQWDDTQLDEGWVLFTDLVSEGNEIVDRMRADGIDGQYITAAGYDEGFVVVEETELSRAQQYTQNA